MKRILLLLIIMSLMTACKDDFEPTVWIWSPSENMKVMKGMSFLVKTGADYDHDIYGIIVVKIDGKNMKEIGDQRQIGDDWVTVVSVDSLAYGKHYAVADFRLSNGDITYDVNCFEVAEPVFPSSIEMVTVEGGTFTMGNNSGEADEQPEHQVTLTGFQIGKYEITNQQFCDFLNDVNAVIKYSYEEKRYYYCGYEVMDQSSLTLPEMEITYDAPINTFNVKSGYENYPVKWLTFFGAKLYCLWAGGRLPTEAEWEFAARGGNLSLGYVFSGSNIASDVAWCESNSGGTTHPVGQKLPNELGIYDMSGNTGEYCADYYSSEYYAISPSVNPTGPDDGLSWVARSGLNVFNRGIGGACGIRLCRDLP